MTGMHHYTQLLLVEMGSHKLNWASLVPQSSQAAQMIGMSYQHLALTWFLTHFPALSILIYKGKQTDTCTLFWMKKSTF
jgi:hypothetical protein